MSILYLFPEPLPLPKARGIQVINTVASLADQGQHVYLAYVPVAIPTDPFAAYGLTKPENVTLVPLSRRLPWPLASLRIHSGRLFFWRLMAWLHRTRLGKDRPDVIMVRHVKLAHWLLEASVALPIVYEAHEVFVDGASPRKAQALARIEQTVLRKASHVVTITEQLAIKLRQRFGVERAMTVIPSATTLPTTVPQKRWAALAHSIVYAGSLYGWKGAQDLVAAAQYLPGCRITIIGGDAEEVARLSSALPAEGAEVEFLGHLPHQEVIEKLTEACIAVLPNRQGSVSEFTSPLKLFEYMAAGCAIVVSDLPVFREVLGPEDASWFAAGDPEQLAAAIRRLTEDSQRAESMGERMRELAKRYTWQARAERLVELFAALSNNRKQERV